VAQESRLKSSDAVAQWQSKNCVFVCGSGVCGRKQQCHLPQLFVAKRIGMLKESMKEES
jgi:hypothetical protein